MQNIICSDNYRHGVYYRNSLIIYSFKFIKRRRHIFSQFLALLAYTNDITGNPKYYVSKEQRKLTRFQKIF